MTVRIPVFIDHHKLSGSRVDVGGVLSTLILRETSLEIVAVFIDSLGLLAIHHAIFHRAAVAVT